MARTKDPTGLTAEEREEFRELIREVKEATGVTNQEIADQLGWTLDKVNNALRNSAAVRAGTAMELIDGLLRSVPRGRRTREASHALAKLSSYFISGGMPRWVQRYHERTSSPAAFIVPSDVDRLSGLIADEIVASPGFSRAKRATIQSAVVRTLRREAPAMLQNWFSIVSSRVEAYIAEAQYGEHPWKSWDSSGLSGPPLEQEDDILFAGEVLYLAVDLFVEKPKRKGTKTK